MKWKEIFSRLTGISTPVIGASWRPLQSKITVARRLLTFLEDRRVLYAPEDLEFPEHCIKSVLEIRKCLSDELLNLTDRDDLRDSLRAMRAACRKFLDATGPQGQLLEKGERRWSSPETWEFMKSLGELRGVFGIHIARIAALYGLDIDDQLAVILPAKDNDD